MEISVKEFDMPSSFGASSSTFRYNSNSFSGGSDHAEFTESTVSVPCVMLLQWPDLFYHTSMDTLDKVSEDSLRRVGWITTVAILTLANATAEDALPLAHMAASEGVIRIRRAGLQAVEQLFKKEQDPKLKEKSEELAKELAKTGSAYTNRINHVVWREQESARSVRRLGTNPELNAFLNENCKEIRDTGEKEIRKLEQTISFLAKKHGLNLHAQSGASEELKRLVPVRFFKGTLDSNLLRKELGEKEYEWYRDMDEKDREFSKKAAEIVNFIDGKRSVFDLVNAVSAEYSETNSEYVLKFLRDLEKLKLVSFK